MLASVAVLAAALLTPSAAFAVDPPTNVSAIYDGTLHVVHVTFDPPVDPLATGFTASMCQSSLTCDPAAGTSVDGAAAPIDVPVTVTD
ncbi:MAG: hypothetical protein QOD37_2440, partial [Gaiellales bacterium]|nr:hypothetical protein [Gaiellales bacterium]